MDNFVVSARKYRPATFESVVGQKHITSTLRNAISRNQLAHAYLFCGPRGVGKTTCARIFAKAINCLAPGESEACGECESCRSFNEGRSFNIHELDAASNNSVDDIRSLTEQVRIPPQIGKYSVYIIDEVHMLSAAAFNAFLKTLEEPPAHAVFILATTEKHKIIPTILSRCQIFDFNRIRVEDGVEYLKYIAGQEGVTHDDESLHLIARKADGGMRDALSMFDKAVSFCGNQLGFKEVAETLNVLDYDTYFNITSLILAGDYPSTLTMFDEILRKGFSGQTFITGLNGHFRDLLMCKSPQTVPLLEVTGSLLERYKQQATECDVGFLFDSIAVLTSLDGTLRAASNQRLNIELGLMKLCGLGQKKNDRIAGDTAPLPELRKDIPAPKPVTPSKSVPAGEKLSVDKSAAPAANKVESVEPVAKPETEKTTEIPASAEAFTTEKPETSPKREKEEATPPANGNGKPKAKIPTNGTTISGASITSLLETPKSRYVAVEDEESAGEKPELEVDPESEGKIEANRQRFIRDLKTDRPRIAVAFEGMSVAGNKISVKVPGEALREEILRNRTEILTALSDIASIDGYLELEVIVKEDTGERKPVKPEDKWRYLSEKNPRLLDLKKKLNLDIE